MISVLLIAILAQAAAPQIHVDADGFVTVIEAPEVRAQERRNIEMLDEALRTGAAWRHEREGSPAEVIEEYERILESGMELAPEVKHRITTQLREA